MTLGEFREKTKDLPDNTNIVRMDWEEYWFKEAVDLTVCQARFRETKYQQFEWLPDPEGEERIILI